MRYIILILLTLPIVLLALTNIITQYKTAKITKYRFKYQIVLWLAILIVLVGSFPVYNYLVGNPILDAHELSLFDVAQTTALVYLFYFVNNLRRKNEQNEITLRELHQELSIKLSTGKTRGKN
ncbi:MAG: hypothetical protein JWM52_547 [Candidatus Saccharibacteria bacterium]|nr:hypothetical protein [Candidatus Saccharibacteria bacterium]